MAVLRSAQLIEIIDGRVEHRMRPPRPSFFTPLRPLAEIDTDLKKAEAEILRLPAEVTAQAARP